MDPCDAKSGISLPDCRFTKNPNYTKMIVNIDLSKNPEIRALLPAVELIARGHRSQLQISIYDEVDGKKIPISCSSSFTMCI